MYGKTEHFVTLSRCLTRYMRYFYTEISMIRLNINVRKTSPLTSLQKSQGLKTSSLHINA
jgi:hypothetical protein